jgi:hypothetical protein
VKEHTEGASWPWKMGENLEGLTPLGAPWTFADERVWRREVPPEAIYEGVGLENPRRRRGQLFSRV